MKTIRYRSAGGVVLHQDRVLLLDRPGRGEIRLPKGHIEEGESAEIAAIRETAEESGYADLEIMHDLGMETVEFDYKRKHIVRDEYYFVMRLRSERTMERPPADQAQFQPRWTSVDDAIEVLTFDAEQEVVRKARRAIADND